MAAKFLRRSSSQFSSQKNRIRSLVRATTTTCSLHGPLVSCKQPLAPAHSMHDGPPYSHARHGISVRIDPELPPLPAQASKRVAGDGEEASTTRNASEGRKKPAPTVRVSQSPDNANKDLWAQVCQISYFTFRFIFLIFIITMWFTSVTILYLHVLSIPYSHPNT
jgi:hypothetical protein